MRSNSPSPDEYLRQLPEDRKLWVEKLHNTLIDNLPEGFECAMQYGMLSYVVPHKLYPAGYHCDPKQPLPFMGLASQKNAISLYHMGLYADPVLMDWFQQSWSEATPAKLDIGKSCIRFKKLEQTPFDLIAHLAGKMNPQQWITLYENSFRKGAK